jgi:hypothetical protein
MTFLTYERPIARAPPIPIQESGHDAIPAATVPDQNAIRREHACHLFDHAPIVARIREESKRGEEVDDGIVAAGPASWQPTHVAARVPESRPDAAFACPRQEIGGVVQPIDVIARLGEQMRVSALPARYVENASAGRQPEHFDETRYLVAIALEREERIVLNQILVVEIGRPPIGGRPTRGAQKNTGSR